MTTSTKNGRIEMFDEQMTAESELDAILAQIQVDLHEAAERLCDALEVCSSYSSEFEPQNIL